LLICFTGMVRKEGKEQLGFARIFNPERFDESFSHEIKEKGDNDSVVKTKKSLHKVIDLHGCTAFKAEKLLKAFFLTARQEGVTMITVITGRGVHSQGIPVLPDLVEQKIMEFQYDGIIDKFYWDKGCKEISGRLIVMLKNKR